MTTNLILPVFFNKFEYSNFGPFFLIFFIGSITISIIKHRLFGIRFLAGQIISMTANVLIPLISFYLSLFVLKIFWGDVYSINAVLTGVVIALLFSVFYSFVERSIKTYLQEKFLYDGANPVEEREKYIRSVSSELNIDKLSDLTISIYKKVLDIEKVGLILFNIKDRSVIYKKFDTFNEDKLQMVDLLEVIAY